MEQRICRMTRSALQFLQCTKLCVSNSNLFLHVVEGSGRAPQISGRLWHVCEGFWEALGSVLDGFCRFWEALEGSVWAVAGLWTALAGALNAALEQIWTALDGLDGFERGLDGSGRLWALRIAAGSLLAAYGI